MHLVPLRQARKLVRGCVNDLNAPLPKVTPEGSIVWLAGAGTRGRLAVTAATLDGRDKPAGAAVGFALRGETVDVSGVKSGHYRVTVSDTSDCTRTWPSASTCPAAPNRPGHGPGQPRQTESATVHRVGPAAREAAPGPDRPGRPHFVVAQSLGRKRLTGSARRTHPGCSAQ